MLGVVVPAHDEEEHIEACLESLRVASRHRSLSGEHVLIVVVLDACTDGTAAVARRLGATVVETDARNVGIARSVGADVALGAGARWLAFTDAVKSSKPANLVFLISSSTEAPRARPVLPRLLLVFE